MKIKSIKLGLFLLIGLSIVFTRAIGAKELTSKDEVEKLLSGNTVELQDVKWKKSVIWYLKKSGRAKSQDEYGNRGKFDWYVDENGRFCSEKKLRKLRCRVLLTRKDGGYDAYEREYADNELKWIFKRILPGNPHDL